MGDEKSAAEVTRAGVYVGLCDRNHHVTITLVKGELFPPCGMPLEGGGICESAVSYEFTDFMPMIRPAKKD